MKIGQARRALRPDAQAFDQITITTVPRFKTSGMSGDEWRISAKVTFFRKGQAIHEKTFRDVETACHLLSWAHSSAVDDGRGYFGGYADFCDQEGCAETASVTLALKTNACDQCGHRTEKAIEFRRFCARHAKRGDADLEDSDDNYEVIEGAATPCAADESPSVFGGFIAVDGAETPEP